MYTGEGARTGGTGITEPGPQAGKLEMGPKLGVGGSLSAHRVGDGNELASRKGVPTQLAILREQ